MSHPVETHLAAGLLEVDVPLSLNKGEQDQLDCQQGACRDGEKLSTVCPVEGFLEIPQLCPSAGMKLIGRLTERCEGVFLGDLASVVPLRQVQDASRLQELQRRNPASSVPCQSSSCTCSQRKDGLN